MSKWNECRLIDVFSNVDISLLESDSLEEDLDQDDLWAD